MSSRGEKAAGIFGAAFLAAGLLFNDFALLRLLSRDSSIGDAGDRFLLRAACVLLIAAGAWLLRARRSPVAAKALLAMLCVLLGAGLAEIGLRVKESVDAERDLRVDDPALHHTLKPNAIQTQFERGKWIRYATNSLGYRDAAVRQVPKKSEHKRRIVLLGDSFTAAAHVRDEDSFARRLEGMLRAGGIDAEVLNAGVTSYSPSLELAKLKRFLADGYSADEVYLLLDISDIQDEGAIYNHPPPPPPTRRTRIVQLVHPRLFEALKNAWTLLVQPEDSAYWNNPRANWTERDPATEPWIGEGVARSQAAILEIAKLCKAKRMAFTLVIYPWPHQIASEKRPSPHQAIFGTYARTRGIALIDLFPDFFALSDWRPYYIRGDSHWTELGHAFVAEKLSAYRRTHK